MPIASGVESVGMLKFDPKSRKIYFTNPTRGTLESVDPNEPEKRNVIYRGLDKPNAFSVENE